MRGRRTPVVAGSVVSSETRGGVRGSGFTLVEILIVIAIVGVLASLALQVVPAAKENGNIAVTEVDINTLSTAVERYEQDEGEYPGQGLSSSETNQFPILFNALFGERRPRGREDAALRICP